MTTDAVATESPGLGVWIELTKPRITATVTFTTFVGFALGAGDALWSPTLMATLLGTALVASGASAFNMLIERDTDALMMRTRDRPLPSGRMTPRDALRFGAVLTATGVALLAAFGLSLAAAVAVVTWASYLFVYTPLKTRTSLSTIVGAFPGALPPVIGWSAARQAVEPGAYFLFAILFLWQIPHFLAIASLHRSDYARGGLPMLPVVDPRGGTTGRQAVAYSLALAVVSITPVPAGLAGIPYLIAAGVLGVAFCGLNAWAAAVRTAAAERAVAGGSVAYLVTLLTVLLVDAR